jgi:hypothetical protein
MHLPLLDTRTDRCRRRYTLFLVAALCACPWTPNRAAPMQGPPAQAATTRAKPEASLPMPGGISNAPRAPDRLSADQMAQHSMMTDREQMLSYSILLFGLAVLIVQYLLLRSPRRNSYEILQLLAINLIVTGTLFLISAGFSAQQISPGLGLFGTIAGYVLGRRAGDTPKNGKPADNDRGAP